MTMVIGYHEIEDSERWLSSSKRDEVLGPLGISVRTFLDPENPNRAALLMDVPDMAQLQAMLQSPQAAEAMREDGVRAETMVILTEA